MDATRIAQPAHPSTREERGLELYQEHADEITFVGSVWLVPSMSEGGTSLYEVRLGRAESCERFDYGGRQEPCKHVFVATVARPRARRRWGGRASGIPGPSLSCPEAASRVPGEGAAEVSASCGPTFARAGEWRFRVFGTVGRCYFIA